MLRCRRSHLAVALVLVWTLLGCFINCDPVGPPEPSGCDNAPDRAELTMLALGSGSGAFTPLDDGAATTLVVGGQGLTMVSLRVGFQAVDPPACARVRLVIRDPSSGSTIETYEADLATAPEGDWRATGEIFRIVGDWPDVVTIVVEAYGTTIERTVRLGGDDAGAGTLDGGA